MKFLTENTIRSLGRMESLLLKLIYVLSAGIILTQMLDADRVSSVLFHVLILVTAAVWLLMQRNKPTRMDYFVLGIIILAVLFVFINGILCDADFGFSYLKKVMLFATAMLFFQIAQRRKLNKRSVTFIYYTMNVITVMFIIMFFAQGVYKYWYVNRISPYLTFKFSNPNFVAMFLLCLFMLQMIWLFTKESPKTKWIHLAFAVFLAYCIFETRARNSQLVMILFLVFYVLLLLSKRRYFQINKIFAVLVGIFPALFFILYMTVINNKAINKLFGFAVSEGKDLDSRVKVWQPAIDGFKESPIIGAYYQISEGTGAGQMHNTHLDILSSYGIIVCVLVCVFLVLLIYQNGRRFRSKLKVGYMIGFCGAITMGMGEAAVFSSGLCLFVFAGTFLLLAKGEEADLYGM